MLEITKSDGNILEAGVFQDESRCSARTDMNRSATYLDFIDEVIMWMCSLRVNKSVLKAGLKHQPSLFGFILE